MKSVAIYLCDPVTKEQTLLNLFEASATIGRGEGADIRLLDLRCALIHAYIERKEDHFLLVDLGGNGGIFYKNKKVQETTIKSGEYFKLGNSDLLLKEIPSALVSSMVSIGNKTLIDSNLEMSEREKNIGQELKESSSQLTLITEKKLLQVSLYWGQQLLEVRTFTSGSEITIGPKKNTTFGVTLFASDYFHLATYKNQEVELSIPPEMGGVLWVGNEIYPIDKIWETKKERDEDKNLKIILRIGDRIDLKIGELVLSSKFVLPSEKISRFVFPKIEKKLLRILSIIFLIYFSFFVLLSLDFKQGEKEEKKLPKDLQKILFKTGVKWAEKEQQSAIGEKISKEGGRSKGAEGQATVRKSEEKNKKSDKSIEKKLTEVKESNLEMVKNVEKDVDINSVFDKTKTKRNVEDVSVEGPKQHGNTLGALTAGNFARGTSGLGEGGGGESVGIGQVKGLSVGGGEGAGDYGVERSKGKEIDVAKIEEVVLLDGLDPEIIATIIKRYLPQVQHCYETELVQKPHLKGKVVVWFQITSLGTTSKGKIVESGMNDHNVENCILNKIKSWQFPKPKGGGTVDVKYPFLLMSTSSN